MGERPTLVSGLVVALIAFIATGWRPNFIHWFFLAVTGAMNREEANSYRLVFKRVWGYRLPLLLMALAVGTWLLLFVTRNYLFCDMFVYISPAVSGLYTLDSLAGRIESIQAMATFINPALDGAIRDALAPFGALLATGWLAGMVAAVLRVGPFARFPLPLALFSWVAAVIFFGKFNILAGYGVRWGAPLMPVWVLSFFFLLHVSKQWIGNRL